MLKFSNFNFGNFFEIYFLRLNVGICISKLQFITPFLEFKNGIQIREYFPVNANL